MGVRGTTLRGSVVVPPPPAPPRTVRATSTMLKVGPELQARTSAVAVRPWIAMSLRLGTHSSSDSLALVPPPAPLRAAGPFAAVARAAPAPAAALARRRVGGMAAAMFVFVF